MNVELILQDFDFRLLTNPGSFPRIEIAMAAVVTSRKVAFDAVKVSVFRDKVRAFVESELPNLIQFVAQEGGAK